MNLRNLMPSKAQEEINKPELNKFNTLMSSSIVGFDYVHNSLEKLGYKEEEFEQEDASMLLDQYNVSMEERSELMTDSKSIQHMYDVLEDKKRNTQQDEAVADMGAWGIAAQLGLGLVDLPSWVIGGGLGKVAGIGIKAYNITGRGSKAIQASAGAASAIGSVAAFEAMREGELTTEQTMINGALGFAIGYGTARNVSGNPETQQAIQNIVTGENPVVINHKKESFLIPSLHSSPDRMKASDNPSAVEIGYRFTTSTGDVGLQDNFTVKDSMGRTGKILTSAKEEFDTFATEFKELNGRDLDIADQELMNKIGLSIDYKFGRLKEGSVNSQKQYKIDKDTGTIETSHKEFVTAHNKETDLTVNNFIKENFVPEEIPSVKLNSKGVETKLSKLRIKQAVTRNEKGIKKFATSNKKKINAYKKQRGKEVTAREKIKNKEVTSTKKQVFSKEDIDVMNKVAIKDTKSDLLGLIESVDPKYKKGIDTVARFKQAYGSELVKHDVDGLGGIDTSFHWSRQYDADRIAQDTDGAVEAFERGLRANFNEIDEELTIALNRQAKSIVDNILASKASFETIDLDKTLAVRAAEDIAKKTNAIGRNLKGRKLRIDGSELTKYMSNDLVGNMSGYSRSVGGKIAVKEALGIDKLHSAEAFALDNNLLGKDKELFDKSLRQALGTDVLDPQANSNFSKIVRAFTGINYINFGGWFGANTLSDLSGIAYDFGLGRAMKYSNQDIVSAIKGSKKGNSLARYIGYAAEGLTNDRALLYGQDGFSPSRLYFGEKVIQKGGALTSKYSGLNMVVDFMDRITSLSSLDYMLTGNINSPKFTRTMNRLGLSNDDILSLRSKKGLVKWENDAISDFKFDSLDTAMKAKLERGLRRSVEDVVLKGNSLDAPEFLTEILGSPALAKALFQFMRFPVIAYNKIGRKMVHNFDTTDAIISTATAAVILGTITQMKDIGKEKPRYDLDTKEGQMKTISFIIERMPHLAFVGLVQTQVDILGRLAAKGLNEDYKQYSGGMNLGVTMERINTLSESANRIVNGTESGQDIVNLKTYLSTNMLWLQPVTNMVNDTIKKEY